MTERPPNPAPDASPRAPRFAIQVPLRYRVSGEVNWQEGRTENISRSGVLFRAWRRVESKTSVEMSFVLPVEVGAGEGGAEVICHGYIVRAVEPVTPENLPGLAAAIVDYRFLRREEEVPNT